MTGITKITRFVDLCRLCSLVCFVTLIFMVIVSAPEWMYQIAAGAGWILMAVAAYWRDYEVPRNVSER